MSENNEEQASTPPALSEGQILFERFVQAKKAIQDWAYATFPKGTRVTFEYYGRPKTGVVSAVIIEPNGLASVAVYHAGHTTFVNPHQEKIEPETQNA